LAIVPPPVSEKKALPGKRRRRRRLDLWVRAALIVIALSLIGIFAIAIALDPYKDGKVWLAETHRQMGLPPCTFKDITGLPCPSCGMTSSFALAIRGDLVNSLQANWVGTLLALGCLAFIPWGIVCAFKGRLLLIGSFENLLIYGVLAFVLLMLGRWAIVLCLIYFFP
jgi:hypothetical protein